MKSKITPKLRAEMMKMHMKGMSSTEIARELDSAGVASVQVTIRICKMYPEYVNYEQGLVQFYNQIKNKEPVSERFKQLTAIVSSYKKHRIDKELARWRAHTLASDYKEIVELRRSLGLVTSHRKMRTCLSCGKSFDSAGNYNRICYRCSLKVCND
jgi:hypothetical protein